MRVGVVKEIKTKEARVGLTPAGAAVLVADGHEVLVEQGAGVGAGFDDHLYEQAGAKLTSREDTWNDSELLVKVKEPIASEYGFLREDLTLFTYLHLAADRPLTEALLDAGTLSIAYETVQDATGLPLLTPMSEIAGRLAAHAAATYLTAPEGGPGLLLGGSPGVMPARVVVIGGGVVGTQAALLALGMQAEVTILDTSARRIRELEALFGGRARVVVSDPESLARELAQADVVIGAVLVPGGAAPKVVRRTDLGLLKPDALLIDVAIDQGGAFESSRPTTYADPIYIEEDIRHYCVANMPGGVPQTSTRALTNATFPYLRRLAAGPADAIVGDPALALGVNTRDGKLTHHAVALAFADLPQQD
ncbi:alanine dehydrogenase [Streptomyces yanii]|uniref:Alanine dehydrogenase n=1 Tax=Streptomyces yanii TaxID=78510 RepID=A0ABV5R7F5_9ACTN